MYVDTMVQGLMFSVSLLAPCLDDSKGLALQLLLGNIAYQISRLLELFHASEENSNVKMIILKGNGRAFCAGGDLVLFIMIGKTEQKLDVWAATLWRIELNQLHLMRDRNWKLGADYYREEFTLNYVMATYSKPQVSILNGIVMGGGLGVSVHGRFWYNEVCAMPETALGLFPDVGASYFYSRLPGFFGEYAGLTGSLISATYPNKEVYFMARPCFSYLGIPLPKCSLDLKGFARLKSIAVIRCNFYIISRFSNIPKLKAESPCHKMKIIDRCFSRRTIEEIISSLVTERKLPTSLKISLRSIREGRLQGVGSCLIREYRMGCRAILIDKDKVLRPARLELIRDGDVDVHFYCKIDDERLGRPKAASKIRKACLHMQLPSFKVDSCNTLQHVNLCSLDHYEGLIIHKTNVKVSDSQPGLRAGPYGLRCVIINICGLMMCTSIDLVIGLDEGCVLYGVKEVDAWIKDHRQQMLVANV
ncbi:3-hydroxyisobutyryl-CoA hydrolase 1 [Datura stramonium]|uniref:3-hydroxyisobutyryl-CoA hydrolase n=1 Tax=Datura stramonium TaxID=4076 RepID=A0ABS8TAW9_DATST|nr:3-hydroxyisobutyryl-CoA hydrolase 1 [Datura stramonium]